MHTLYHLIKSINGPLVCLLITSSLVACGNANQVNIRESQKNPITTPVVSPKAPRIDFHSEDNVITGIILDATGTKPVTNATLYIPKLSIAKHDTLSPLSLSSISTSPNLFKSDKCKRPSVPYVTFTCSDQNGHFSLTLTQLESLPIHLNILKADRFTNIDLSINDIGSDLGSILFSTPNETVATRIAIVLKTPTALDNRGRQIDTANISEPLLSFAATDILDQYGVDATASTMDFTSLAMLLEDKDGDSRVDIYNYTSVLIAASWKTEWSQISEASRQLLLQYVEKGGQLFFSKANHSKRDSDLEEFI